MGTGFALACWFGVKGQTAIQVPVSKVSLVKCYQTTSVFFFLSFFFLGGGCVCMCVYV